MPLLVAVIFFALYLFLARSETLIDSTARELFFGKDFRYVRFFGWIALIIVAVRALDSIIFDLVLSRRQKHNVPLLLRQIISFALYVFLFGVAISAIFKTQVTTLVASGTVLAAVLGLALQDTLGNLFSGISVHVEQTFEVGDVIRSGDVMGVVEAMNWRATRLRTFNNNIVVIPNSVVSHERVEVFPKRNLNSRIVTVSAPYDQPPAKVIRVLEQAAGNITNVAKEIPCLARVGGFGESAIVYEVKYWTRSYQHRDSIDAEIRRAVWYAFKRNGIPIPFPIRTLHRHHAASEEGGITPEAIGERLEAVDILAPLSPEERAQLARGTRVLHYSRGETILGYGEQGQSMYVVHDGTVSVRAPSSEGFVEVAQLGPGNIFGEMALLTGESRTADVIAIEDVTALQIRKNVMQPLLLENPELAAALSIRIMERQAAAASLPSPTAEEHHTLLGRIRSYFGLSK